MTIIGFVRHGITDWNIEQRTQGITDVPLNDLGRRQARALAERLAAEPWDVIYASDLSRARETAEIAAQALGLEVLTDARLRERCYGEAETTTLEERLARWGADWHTLPEGLESEEEVYDRVISFLNEILTQHAPDSRMLIFSHGNLISIALKRLVPHLNAQGPPDNTSLTRLVYVDGKWDCELYNCAKHLSAVRMDV